MVTSSEYYVFSVKDSITENIVLFSESRAKKGSGKTAQKPSKVYYLIGSKLQIIKDQRYNSSLVY